MNNPTLIIRTITNVEELELVRPFWLEKQHHPNSDIDLFKLVCQLRPEIISSCIFTVERNSLLCSLLVARLERSYFVPSVGYFKPFRIPVIVLRVLHEGLLGDENEEIATLLVSQLRTFLESRHVDAVTFHHHKESSLLIKTLLAQKTYSWFQYSPNWSVHRSMLLGGEPGFLLKSMRSKHRSWIRKKERELESAYKGQISWRWLDQFDELDNLCSELENVAALSYQRGLGAGFINDEEHRKRFKLFSEHGQLRIQLLETQGKVRAFWIGVIYRNVFHSWATCYDSQFGKYEPGTLLFLRLTDELVREGVSKLDFGLGDAHYKERFGDNSWREASLSLFAPTFKGYLIGTVMGIFDIIDKTSRQMVSKVKLADLIKTKWRQHLQR